MFKDFFGQFFFAYTNYVLLIVIEIKFGSQIALLPNLEDYMGRWYEIERLQNFEAGQECVFATYTLENGPQG